MLTGYEIVLLVVGGFAAGFVNTLAGGGSFLTVPLLIEVGVPPTIANGTNRVGVLFQNLAAVTGFRQEGVPGISHALRLMPATLLGAWLGALSASSIPDEVFGRAFGLIMLAALPVILWNPKPVERDAAERPGAWQHVLRNRAKPASTDPGAQSSRCSKLLAPLSPAGAQRPEPGRPLR